MLGPIEPVDWSASDLLEQWREATRAAELAARLAQIAAESAEQAERGAVAADEIAELAGQAAQAAERAATVARQAAERARAFATDSRDTREVSAVKTAADALSQEAAARDRYHEAERTERQKQGLEPPR
jgi:hypothetical protein